MVILNEVPAAIEGNRILIAGLKIQPSVAIPQKIKSKAGEIKVFSLTVERRGEGTIEEEYNPPKKEDEKHREYSLVKRGDKIEGKSLWGFSTSPLRNGDIRCGDSGRSGAHTGQQTTLRGKCCYLELINGWRGQPLDIHPKDTLVIK